MKKIIVTLTMLAMLIIALPLTSNAQIGRRGDGYRSRNRAYAQQRYNRPSFYRRHRNAVNVAAGTGGGALLGALIGGKKGAAIGALVGAGGSALYTYKIKPKQRRY